MRRRSLRPRIANRRAIATATVASSVTACAGAPGIFKSSGLAASRLGTLGWFLTICACAVTVAVVVILIVALMRARRNQTEVKRLGPTTAWIVIGGVIVPAIILVAAFVFSVFTQSALANPPSRPAATIRVLGHRWWWEVTYVGAPEQTVVTANEIHIPVGQPVQLELASNDVIHSFWVPNLAGKTDLIPGQRNTMWMEADHPGTYWGQCAEYCGMQHAHMDFVVVAQPPAEFQSWLAAQRVSAIAPEDSVTRAGLEVFQSSSCAACHAIRGSEALGRIGPDLTHLQSRRTLASGVLTNTPENLARWITHAQSIKPGSEMPTVTLPAANERALVAYLESLH